MEMRGCKGKKTTMEETEGWSWSFFDRMPEHILEDVLMRLPNSKMVIQCKLVCKSWYSIVSKLSRCSITNTRSSNSFTLLCQWRADVYQNPKFPVLALSTSSNTVSHFDLGLIPAMELSEHEGIAASCHDLLLVSYQGTYHVVNPEIRQWMALPPPPPSTFDCPLFGASCKTGFLWDYDSDLNLRYKVIRIGHASSLNVQMEVKKFPIPGADISVQIYDSDTNDWSDYVVDGYPFTLSHYLTDTPVISHNGMFHWLNCTYLVSLNPFDLRSNDAEEPRLNRIIRLPEKGLLSPSIDVSTGFVPGSIITRLLGFGVTGSHIQVITEHIYVGRHFHPLFVWQLEETKIGDADASRMWCVTHSVLHSVFPNSRPSMFLGFLAFHPYEGDVLFLQGKEDFFQINLCTKVSIAFNHTEPYTGTCRLNKAFPPLLHRRFPTQLTPPLTWQV